MPLCGGGWAAGPLTRAWPPGSFPEELAEAATARGECVGLWSAATGRTPLHLSLRTECSGAEGGLGEAAAPTTAQSPGRERQPSDCTAEPAPDP